MKKFLFGFAIILFLFQTLAFTVSAARFRDDMDRLDSSPAITYNNLALSSKIGAGNDTLFKTADSALGGGSVVYRINGASKVSASIYSALGTQPYADADGSFFLADGLSHSPLTTVLLPTFFSPSDKGVYLLPGGSPQKLFYRHNFGYYFSPAAVLPNDLINYTVQVSVSANGKDYSSLSVLRSSSEILETVGLVREEWSAVVPTGVSYLKIELNDFTQIFAPQQQITESRSLENMAMLAHVDIEGDGLIIGVPQPIEVSTGSSSSSNSSKEESSSSKTSSKKASSSSSTNSTVSSSPSSSLSSTTSKKFEGVVLPEISTSKDSLGTPSSKFEGNPSTSTVAILNISDSEGSSDSAEDGKSDTFFFAAAEDEKTKNSPVFITAYVIILMAGIFVSLKNRSGKGK